MASGTRVKALTGAEPFGHRSASKVRSSGEVRSSPAASGDSTVIVPFVCAQIGAEAMPQRSGASASSVHDRPRDPSKEGPIHE